MTFTKARPSVFDMKSCFTIFFSLAAVAHSASKRADAVSVTGSPPGFAYGVTGGGDASPIYPTDVTLLIELLGSSNIIVQIIMIMDLNPEVAWGRDALRSLGLCRFGLTMFRVVRARGLYIKVICRC